jgi:glycosyltransferase involved in cell wall biosynthesis
MEAICSGTPVLASRIDGNIGLLGEDYAGLFDLSDAAGLAALLRRCHEPLQGPALLARLARQCALRAPLFQPQAEQAALHRWVQDLWTV